MEHSAPLAPIQAAFLARQARTAATRTTDRQKLHAKKRHAKMVLRVEAMRGLEEESLSRYEADREMVANVLESYYHNPSSTDAIQALQRVLHHRVQYYRRGTSIPVPPSITSCIFTRIADHLLTHLVLPSSRSKSSVQHIPRVTLRLKDDVRDAGAELRPKPFFAGDLTSAISDPPTPIPVPESLEDWYDIQIDPSAGDFTAGDMGTSVGMSNYAQIYVRELRLTREEAEEALEMYIQAKPGDSPWAVVAMASLSDAIGVDRERRNSMRLADEGVSTEVAGFVDGLILEDGGPYGVAGEVGNMGKDMVLSVPQDSESFSFRYAGISRVYNGLERMAYDMASTESRVRITNFLGIVGQVLKNHSEEDNVDDDSSTHLVLARMMARTLVVVEIPEWCGDRPEPVLEFLGDIEDAMILAINPDAMNSAFGGFYRRVALRPEVLEAIDNSTEYMIECLENTRELVKEQAPTDQGVQDLQNQLQTLYLHETDGFAASFGLTDVRSQLDLALAQIADPIRTIHGRVSTFHVFKDVTVEGFQRTIPFFHPLAGSGPRTAREVNIRIWEGVKAYMNNAANGTRNFDTLFLLTLVFGPFVNALPTPDHRFFYIALLFLRRQLMVLRPLHVTAHGEGVVAVFLFGLLGDQRLPEKAERERGQRTAGRTDGTRLKSLQCDDRLFELVGRTFVCRYGPHDENWCLVSPAIDPGCLKHDPAYADQYLQLIALETLRRTLLDLHIRSCLQAGKVSLINSGGSDAVRPMLDGILAKFEEMDLVRDIKARLSEVVSELRQDAAVVKSLRASSRLSKGAPFSRERDLQLNEFSEALDLFAYENGRRRIARHFPCPLKMEPCGQEWVIWARGVEEGGAFYRSANSLGHTVAPDHPRNTTTTGTASNPIDPRYPAFVATTLALLVSPTYVAPKRPAMQYQWGVCTVDGCPTGGYLLTPQTRLSANHECKGGEQRPHVEGSHNLVLFGHDVLDVPRIFPFLQDTSQLSAFGLLSASQVFPPASAELTSLGRELGTLVQVYPFTWVYTKLNGNRNRSSEESGWEDYTKRAMVDHLLQLYNEAGRPSVVFANQAGFSEQQEIPNATAIRPNFSLRTGRKMLSVADVVGNPQSMEWSLRECPRCRDKVWWGKKFGTKQHQCRCTSTKTSTKELVVTRDIWRLSPAVRHELYRIWINPADPLRPKMKGKAPFGVLGFQVPT
ncbi:hypothetical protein HDU93_001769 [Gonapodya sp. JEL0774]|nr:hypothetical protein HDU93_001769 [Gonapodya sp. JEL0774]